MTEQIDELLSRGIERIYPSKEFLEAKILRGEKVKLYLGIDPTGPTLHLGSAIILKKLSHFQKLGHKVILLIGDFTGMIGDPTDKGAARKRQTREDVLENARLYQGQASAFLDFTGPNKAELRYNSEWLSKMNFADVVELASHFTVQQMLERDMFENRMKDNKPIYVHEFMYPLMQGYDSVAMDVDGEIGGNDQTFNMLAGRTLMKQVQNKEKFVITMKLLTDSSGKKMGKTEGNMVSLSDNENEMFGKVMSWSDEMIFPSFELCTNVSLSEIDEFRRAMEGGKNPKELKMHLAKEIVTLCHGVEKAESAEKSFNETFAKGKMPDDALSITVESGEKLSEILLLSKLVASKSEIRRLLSENAIGTIEGEKITNIDHSFTEAVDLKIGKHRFLKVRIK